MTSEEQFNCVFCKEGFSNKEELQIHFRRHADPSFKNETPNSPNGSEKITEENEMVGCDVCEETFPTISKAITHKHKVHPDHDAKYFCPFCGKLFTMKHLYNKHIQTNHNSQLSVEKSDFHCDTCEVMFYLPSAMLYHNKFFHRQDSEVSAIGGSKKVKIYSKEMIQLFYCSFCGEEYNNKVNLQKHISDDHSDENHSPDEVLKCPLCEAIFHHLDAYELHLMFHSTEDEYSERNEMVDEVTEFSLETVPPIMEKVENESSQDNTADEAMDVDNFLQLLINEGDGGSEKQKSKKHKKHKKSKKPAITLDEFLNMNKDVFGDGLDVQGIEEVPSQVMFKKMQVKKGPPIKTLNADINKLQKIGITVKTKSGNIRPLINRCAVTQSTPKIIANKSSVNDPKELLSKLMRQGNSQIKIVKKSAAKNVCETNVQENAITETTEEKKQEDDSINNEDQKDTKPCEDEMISQDSKSSDDDENKCNAPNDEMEHDDKDKVVENQELINADILMQGNVDINNKLDKSDSKSDGKLSTDLSPSNSNPVMSGVNEFNKDNKADNSSCSDKEVSDGESNDSEDNVDKNTANNTIGALKHLSHLIIKPVKPTKTLTDSKVQNSLSDNKNNSEILSKAFDVSSNNVNKQESSNIINKTSGAIRNLNKNISVKPVTCSAAKIDSETEEAEINDEHIDINNSSKYASQWPTENISPENRLDHATTKISVGNNNKGRNSPSNPSYKKPEIKLEKPILNKAINEEIEIFNIDDSDSDDATKEEDAKETINETKKAGPQYSNVLHNLGSNITIKSTTQKTNEVKINANADNTNNQPAKKVNKPTPEIQKSINLQNTLKNLGSNITIKSNNTTTYSQEENNSFDEDELNSDHFDSESEAEDGKVKITEVTEETSDVDNGPEGNADAIVQSPEAQDNDSDNFSNDEDSEFNVQPNTDNLSGCQTPKSNFPNNIKCLNKDLVIKPVSNKNNSENIAKSPYENKASTSYKAATHTSGPSSQMNTINRNSNSSDEVNTVKTVKKYQTQTVIEEVTTVTRTIRTINESSNEVCQTNNQSCGAPPKLNRNQPSRDFNQVKVLRHATPTNGAKIRTTGNIIRPTNATNFRIPNQIVPIRTSPGQVRQISPIQRQPLHSGAPFGKKMGQVISNNPQKQVANKLKMSPNVIKQLSTKRPSDGFPNFSSNVKKYKDCTMSMSAQKNMNNPMEQYTASTSRSEFSSVTKVVQGGKAMTQTRSEVNTQQQLSRLSNMSGLKIMKSSTKQASQVEEKTEISASKRNTLEAIEKLQKQGLLVKKPKIEDEPSEQDYFSESDQDDCEQ